ncbi:Cytochrome b561 [Epibacterium ulvae]|uniref:Cytochrome b561 n=1 Tax=Epibacterium ulvae TaxID=1156985 RepID=A0A1G5RC01_9RHOB|nr:cytochrome b/b6 domain-containing protein [Epibacterium ulvae]SCZ71595.1 Cytochrome b561 [Epibacterium ulvae]
MSLINSFSRYGSISKGFHWATVLLIFSTFPIGYFANGLAEQIRSPDFSGDGAVITRTAFLFSLHKTIGILALLTAALRIFWTLTQAKPGLLHPDNKAEALAAETVHWLLYALMVAVPLTGWIHHAAATGFAPIWWPFGQGLPFVPQTETVAGFFGSLHWVMVWSLFAVVVLHIAGALKHHVIDRDNTLRRMLPRGGQVEEPPAQAHSKAPFFVAASLALVVLAGAQSLGYLGGHDHDHSHDHAHDHAAQTDSVATVAATASQWAVQSGTLTIEVAQFGGIVEGQFATWTAAIDFEEPAAPGPAGSVEVVIDISSLKLGSVTDQALGADYFDVASFPTATFNADLEKLDTGYQAVGTLTIRDKTQPLILPFDLELNGATAVMRGQATVQRLAFDIGQSQSDESSLGFDVVIKADLTAQNTK